MNKTLMMCFVLLVVVITKQVFLLSARAQTSEVTSYSLEEILQFFSLDTATNKEAYELFIDAHLCDLSFLDISEDKLSIDAFIECFPYYINKSERCSDTDLGYYTYLLDDGSKLFLFYLPRENMLTHAWHMYRRCDSTELSSVKPEYHSLQDVMLIDKNTQFNPLVGWGPVSEHCASDGSYWQIIYEYVGEKEQVKSVHMVGQGELVTILRYISPLDMP